MPQLPPAQGVTRAVLNYTSQGIKTANVLHFSQPPGPSAPVPADLASDLAAWWISNMKNLTHTTHRLDSVVCTDLSAGGAPASEYTTGLPSSGTTAGDPAPNMCAAVVTVKTAIRGRSYRGRIYVGGLSETHFVGNTLDAAWRGLLLTAWSKLIIFTTGVLTPDLALGVLSYYTGGSIRGTPVFTPSTVMSVDATVDTQRRRMR